MRLPRRLSHDQSADLVTHLDELRGRLVVSLIALAGGFTVAFVLRGHIISYLNGPLPGHKQPITFGVAEPFMTSIKIGLFGGFALALPVILWQVWSYFAPALEPRIQRTVAWCVLTASVLFGVGVVFAAKVALPAAVKFLTTYDNNLYNIQVRAADYYSFAFMVLAAVGLVFELPVFVVALVRIGITTSDKLRKNRRYGYIIVAALAVALPGVDPVTTAFEMVPLLVLFEASIWFSVLFERRARRAAVAGSAL